MVVRDAVAQLEERYLREEGRARQGWTRKELVSMMEEPGTIVTSGLEEVTSKT